MKVATIDWWKKNQLLSSSSKYKNYLNKIITKYSGSGNPMTTSVFHSTISFFNSELPLLEIPYALKDNISTKNIKTCCGSKILKGYKPPFNATVVKLLNEKGASLVFKTHLDELGMGGTGLLSAYGKLFSPWNNKRIVGGSSSGSCFAVTTGMVPFAIGSDTGDSVRRPAALNGIIGFKPSWGSVSRYGLFPYAPSLDTISWFTNSVTDCKTLLKILNQSDMHDGTKNPDKLKKKQNTKYRIGYDQELFHKVHNQDMEKKYEIFLKQIKNRKNVELINIQIDKKLLNLAWSIYIVISFTEALSSNYNLGGIHFGNQADPSYMENYDELVYENRKEGFSNTVKSRFGLAALCLNKENQKQIYIKAKKARKMVQIACENIYKKVDIIIGPASDNVAPFISDDDLSQLPSLKQDPNWIIDYAVFANLNGHPSMTLPIGYAKDQDEELPFSIIMDTAIGNEYLLLNFAQEIEELVQFTHKLQRNNDV